MKTRTKLTFDVVLAALALGTLMASPALAQGSAGAAGVARQRASFIQVSGRPTALMWAKGVQAPEELDQYAALGLNAVYVELGGVSEGQLERGSALAAAARERGLLVVVALKAGTLRDSAGSEVPIDAGSETYVRGVEEFVRTAVESVGVSARPIAWAVEAVPPANVLVDDAGFVAYLRKSYASLNALNGSWGTEFAQWDEVTSAGARDVDSGLPNGIGRPSVDLASYQEAAYADALSVWERALRAADPGGLVLAGALPSYRSIVSVPDAFDGMVLETYPGVAEADWDTHNVQAVDMGRRANRFAAVQTLEVSSETTEESVVGWAGLALAHGAAGVAFSSWGAVRDSDELRSALPWIARLVAEQGYPRAPRAQAAIVYEPYAGGAMMRGRSLYGYLDGVTPGSPTNLFEAAHWGSRFGILDVVRSDDLRDLDLSQYGAIIAPMVFYMAEESQIALHSYVLRGGVLVVDAGIGMYQAEGTTDSMPSVIREILGLRYVDLAELWQEGGNQGEVVVGGTFDPAVPTEGVPLAPGQEGQETDPALTRFVQGMELYVTQADVARYLGDGFVSDDELGFRVKGLGEGFAVYSPEFLYENWDASFEDFNDFHNQVLGYGSDLEITEPEGAWPGPAATFYDDWSLGVASPYGEPTSVLARGAGNQVYRVPSGAVRLYNAGTGDRVELLFPGWPLARAMTVPVYVWPLEEEGVAAVTVVRYGRDGIELVLYGTGNAPRVQDGEVEMVGGEETPVTVEVRSGLYRVSPDSVHRVVVEQGAAGRVSRQWEVMPDPDTGALVIELTVAHTRITIEPVEDEI